MHRESSAVEQIRQLAADGDGAALWTLLECTKTSLSEEELAAGVTRVGEALRKNAEDGGEAHKLLHATFVEWGAQIHDPHHTYHVTHNIVVSL